MKVGKLCEGKEDNWRTEAESWKRLLKVLPKSLGVFRDFDVFRSSGQFFLNCISLPFYF